MQGKCFQLTCEFIYTSFLAYRWFSCRIILFSVCQSVKLKFTNKNKTTNATHRGTDDNIEKDVSLRGETEVIYHLISASVFANVAISIVDHTEPVSAHPAPPE